MKLVRDASVASYSIEDVIATVQVQVVKFYQKVREWNCQLYKYFKLFPF